LSIYGLDKDSNFELLLSKALKKIDIERLKEFKITELIIAQEATILASLKHPNIILFYDSFSWENYFCIITEYCNVNRENISYLIKISLSLFLLSEWLIRQVY
jgi:serine/threonine protein kinase